MKGKPITLFLFILLFMNYSCTDPQGRLINAIEQDDQQRAVKALEQGADINLPDQDGLTPLMLAAQRGDHLVLIGILRIAHASESGMDPHHYESAYQMALDRELWEGASSFHWELNSSEGLGENPLSVAPPDGLYLYAGPDTHMDRVDNLPQGTPVHIERRSLIESQVEGHRGYWVYVSIRGEGASQWGWVFDAFLRGVQELPQEIREERMVDSPGGLNMRDQPSLEGTHITTLPGGDRVMLLREEGDLLTIGGRTGRWSLVEWKNSTQGWVFGGFLGEPTQEQEIWVNQNIPYNASFSTGRYGTDAGISQDEEIFFSQGNRVDYTRTEYFFDGQRITNHQGSYFIQGNNIIIELEVGRESLELYEGSGGMSYAEGFTLELVLLEEPALTGPFDSYMRREYLERVQQENFVEDHQNYRYILEDTDSFTHLGYFHQTGK